MFFQQKEYTIKCEWGLEGLEALLDLSDVIIIVDILSFSTCVDIITSNKSYVFPYIYKDESALNFAKENNLILAEKRNKNKISLSPHSLINIPKNSKILLPSPNGSTLSFYTNKAKKNLSVICSCLRNFRACAELAQEIGKNITIIPAGEKWNNNNTRFSIEDFLGAGAVISEIKNSLLSPESLLALNSFNSVKNNIYQIIKESASGKELIEKGFEEDVKIACELNTSNNTPVLYKDNDIFYYK
ncbi:MAG: 2-phosphosulfolactate phosphatase [Candidatus Sericytochromatia bacterium]